MIESVPSYICEVDASGKIIPVINVNGRLNYNERLNVSFTTSVRDAKR